MKKQIFILTALLVAMTSNASSDPDDCPNKFTGISYDALSVAIPEPSQQPPDSGGGHGGNQPPEDNPPPVVDHPPPPDHQRPPYERPPHHQRPHDVPSRPITETDHDLEIPLPVASRPTPREETRIHRDVEKIHQRVLKLEEKSSGNQNRWTSNSAEAVSLLNNGKTPFNDTEKNKLIELFGGSSSSQSGRNPAASTHDSGDTQSGTKWVNSLPKKEREEAAKRSRYIAKIPVKDEDGNDASLFIAHAGTGGSTDACERTLKMPNPHPYTEAHFTSLEYFLIYHYLTLGEFPKVPVLSTSKRKNLMRVAAKYLPVNLSKNEALMSTDLLVDMDGASESGEIYMVSEYQHRLLKAKGARLEPKLSTSSELEINLASLANPNRVRSGVFGLRVRQPYYLLCVKTGSEASTQSP